MSKLLLIGDLARLAGVKSDSVRFYERNGLLTHPSRGPNGYRVYAPATLAQLRFIKKAQSLGFSLAEIKRIWAGAAGAIAVVPSSPWPKRLWKKRSGNCARCAVSRALSEKI